MEELPLITLKQIKAIKTDLDLFALPRKMRCENLETYELVLKKFSQCHIGTASNRKSLIIVA